MREERRVGPCSHIVDRFDRPIDQECVHVKIDRQWSVWRFIPPVPVLCQEVGVGIDTGGSLFTLDDTLHVE